MALLQKGYLGSTPLFKETDWFEDGARRIVDINSATITADTTAHTKGAWTQIIASTTANTSLLSIKVGGIAAAGTDTATLIDIGTGAGGSETAIVSNIAVGSATGGAADGGINFELPYKIASGTRIAARIQSIVTGGKTAFVEIAAVNAGDYDSAPTAVDTIGTSTATSLGTAMSGASGTWVQVTSSTSNAYRAVVMVPSVSSATIGGNANFTYTLGIGASGSEVEVGSLRFRTGTSETCYNLHPTGASLFGRAYASGSRLAVRHNITSVPASYYVTLIGVR